ncbi:MAG: hypothetical protein F6K25_02340 [Okeania sp. SIO2G4]|uniref:hypothetical protein n=1 Tax=unclassified Okeania TaxID=2634635 RepID=UPI0013BBBEDB|nr:MULTISPECIES: hypothetical protein [unclassified Okeania]NEP70379.1 hypothetical protein [Okeania sp. SIO2G5]NEP91612.1 hypothetical protein [Okeania sp. SIO2F5]NEQ89643.1 hypothetical protein [Okeania sp. SIO2G4]
MNVLTWNDIEISAESTFETLFEEIFYSDKFIFSGLEKSDLEINSLEWVRQA